MRTLYVKRFPISALFVFSILPQRGCFLSCCCNFKQTYSFYVVSNSQVYPDPKSWRLCTMVGLWWTDISNSKNQALWAARWSWVIEELFWGLLLLSLVIFNFSTKTKTFGVLLNGHATVSNFFTCWKKITKNKKKIKYRPTPHEL